jgi:hypothetical protein
VNNTRLLRFHEKTARDGSKRKHRQGMRTESVKIHGARDSRGLALCQAICSVTFCPCNMPAVVYRRRRVIQLQATCFFKWVRWKPEWEHIGTPHRQHAAQCFARSRQRSNLSR